MLKQACPEEILNQVQNDTFRVQHDIFKYFTIYDTVSWGEGMWRGTDVWVDFLSGYVQR